MFNSISVNERDFIIEALKANCRITGRGLNDLRDIRIKFANYEKEESNSKNGQAILSYGRTKILT